MEITRGNGKIKEINKFKIDLIVWKYENGDLIAIHQV